MKTNTRRAAVAAIASLPIAYAITPEFVTLLLEEQLLGYMLMHGTGRCSLLLEGVL